MSTAERKGPARTVRCPNCSHRFEADVAARIWGKIDMRTADECWEWTGGLDGRGYGQASVEGIPQKAHRMAYLLAIGPIPGGLELDHLCRNRACCNPAHLEAVTGEENRRRARSLGVVNAEKTHCPQGHPYDDENTRHKTGKYPARVCRACAREGCRRARAARKEVT